MADVEAARAASSGLHELTAAQAARLIRERRISPVELVEALLRRAEEVDARVQAWETLDAEGALAAAREAEAAVARGGDLGRLHGVPFGAKDIFDTAGVRTSAGFGPFRERVPREDAEAVARLKRAGAILLGKLVTTQFAYADPSRTRNPWSEAHTPAGSSSGSGAGVAAQEVPIALGSQTAGSVLRPAAYNGVVGLKPSYGRISKRGVFPLAWSLDHVGVLARSVEDCALFLAATAGHDPADSASSPRPVPAFELPGDSPAPRLGLLRPALEQASPRLRGHLQEVAGRFEAAGARVREVTLTTPFDLVLAVHNVTMLTEVAAVHWQLLEREREAYGPRIRAYVEAGRLLPGSLYLHAQRLRRRIREEVEGLLAQVDALLLPTAVDVPPGTDTTGDPTLQAPFSLLGLPAISLPSGLVELEGSVRLPLAIQLVASRWQESRLLAAARWCEERLGPMPAPRL